IFSQENISVNERINISNLENGTYFIKISMDNAVTTKKFLIFK
ncbi:MAG: T9SS type A sorting domain-containing protein, partial [Aequorivita sp.]|nr:T9SS type A sorting domain-containing protein [Aequorivita sp.]